MKKLIASTFLSLLLFLPAARAANEGSEFLGKWILIQTAPDLMITIEKDDESFIVHWATYDFGKDVWKEDDPPRPAILDGDALKVEVAGRKFPYIIDHDSGHLKFGGLELKNILVPAKCNGVKLSELGRDSIADFSPGGVKPEHGLILGD